MVPRPIAGADSLRSLQRGTRSLQLGPDGLDGLALLQVEQDLGDAEQADGQRRERQPLGQPEIAEGEARHAGELVEADGADGEAQHDHGRPS